MEIEYIHFYVDDALAWRRWFVHRLGFWSGGGWQDGDSRHERLCSGDVRFLLSSACSAASPIAQYLAHHPPGVVDVALRVQDLSAILQRAQDLGVAVLQEVNSGGPNTVSWARVAGWGSLRHTLVEAEERSPSPAQPLQKRPPQLCWPPVPEQQPEREPGGMSGDMPRVNAPFQRIDHVVLNVAAGALTEAVDWYGKLFDLRSRQSFNIKTPYSGLRSQVLVGEASGSNGQQPFQFPINEPESATSQIQDFLNHNRGPGVQHIALATQALLPTVAHLRQQQIDFLSVPPSYYRQLPLRSQFENQGLGGDWAEIVAQQVLVDWHPERQEGPLLQIFTRPIFDTPTFFFELIERRAIGSAPQTAHDDALNPGDNPAGESAEASPALEGNCAQGFGEGNFQALFEAMELEQRSRNLMPKPLEISRDHPY